MNNRISLFVIMFNFFSSAALAVPENITVDNSQLQSGKLTITGTGFGAQAANVIIYDRFESDTAKEGDSIPLTSPDIGTWTSHGGGGTLAPLYNSIAHSGRFGAQVFAAGIKQFKLDFGTGIQEIFLSYWVRLPNGQLFPGGYYLEPDYIKEPGYFTKDSSWKFTWLYDLDVQGKSSDICLPTHTGYGSFKLAGNDFNIDTAIGNKESWWSWKTWMRISVWLRANSSDPTLDGDVLFQTISAEKGFREVKASTPIFDPDFANGPGEMHEGLPDIKQYQHINIPGWIRGSTDPGTTPIYDDIYIAIGDNSHARVEIADSPNYENAKKIAIQQVSLWSDTNIEINIVEGNFGDALKKASYIFVWDKDGNRNTRGIPVISYPTPPLSIN